MRNDARRRPTSQLIVAACTAAAIVAIPLAVLAAVLALGANVPYWDEWNIVDVLSRERAGTLTFAYLWQPQNGHRLLLNTLAIVGLAKLGAWNVVREQCFSVALLAGTQLALWGIVRRTVRAEYALAVMLLISVALYNLAQVENLSWGFQLGWFLCNACLFVAVWALTAEHVDARGTVVAGVVAVIASLTSSQGLIIWVVGLGCLVLRGRQTMRAAVWSTAGAVVFVVVRTGAAGNDKLAHVAAATHLPLFGTFFLAYLGSPVARTFGVAAAAFAGAATLCAFLAVAVADGFARDGGQALRQRAPWYAIGAYAVIAAGLTAFERLNLGSGEALSSRYTTIGGLMEVALLGALATFAPIRSPRIRAGALAVAALVLCGVGVQSVAGWHTWQTIAQARHDDLAAIAAGNLVGTDLLWDPRRLYVLVEQLRALHDGMFAP